MLSTRQFSRRRWLVLVAIPSFEMPARAADAPGSVPTSPAPTRVIDDIAHWRHPVKDVFAQYKLPLQRVTLKGGHATFRVAFPFDPQAQPNEGTMSALYLDLLRANGGSAYTLESLQDGIAIDVSWKRRPRTIELAIRRL
jgi:hypothetical protein